MKKKDPFKRPGRTKPRSATRLLRGKRKNAGTGSPAINSRKPTAGRNIQYVTKQRKPYDTVIEEMVADEVTGKIELKKRQVHIVPKAIKKAINHNLKA